MFEKLKAAVVGAVDKDRPSPYRLVKDGTDELDWDRQRDGLFADQATADDTVQTVSY